MAGTIEKRGGNSFRLIVYAGYDVQGKQIRHKKTIRVEAKSEKAMFRQAQKELSIFQAEVEKGQYFGGGKMTFQEFVDRWLLDYAEVDGNLAPKTLFRYKEILNSRVIPALGHMKIAQIRPMHLNKFYKSLQQEGVRKDGKKGGLSNKTILQHHAIISSILNDAVQWEVISSNPAAKVAAPKVKKAEVAYYDEEETAALLAALEKEPTEALKYKVAVVLALTTGCRRGELLGLEWSDINFEDSTINIQKAAQYLTGIGHITKDPKNESSKRVIFIPASTTILLKKYKAYQTQERLKAGDLWQYSDRLFVTWNGQPMYPGTISQWFKKLLKRHGLKEITFHGLRHTAATLLIGKGVGDRIVSSLLGHADPGTTKSLYAKSLKSAEKAAANLMESIITGNLGEIGAARE